MFGGRTQNGEILNKLKVLNFNYESEGLCWSTLSVSGRAPQPRYGHSMTYHQNEKMIVIAGGFFKTLTGTVKAYDPQDFKILSLERMEWLNVRYENSIWTSRFGHAAAMFGDQTMFIFGGRTELHAHPNFAMQKITISNLIKFTVFLFLFEKIWRKESCHNTHHRKSKRKADQHHTKTSLQISRSLAINEFRLTY